MRDWMRWRIAHLLGRLPGQCWADLVSWALQARGKRRYYGRWPWQPRTPDCTLGAVRNGRCYCGKLGRDGTLYKTGLIRGGGRHG